MAFQTPITISDALERIHKRQYALPAIQREFVWSQEQICALFDSLMRGYPIGAFLFWEVKKNRYASTTGTNSSPATTRRMIHTAMN